MFLLSALTGPFHEAKVGSFQNQISQVPPKSELPAMKINPRCASKVLLLWRGEQFNPDSGGSRLIRTSENPLVQVNFGSSMENNTSRIETWF